MNLILFKKTIYSIFLFFKKDFCKSKKKKETQIMTTK
jgi:hypothetical protein